MERWATEENQDCACKSKPPALEARPVSWIAGMVMLLRQVLAVEAMYNVLICTKAKKKEWQGGEGGP